MNNTNHDSSDHNAGTFVTGAIVGALIALSLGTKEGQRISKEMLDLLRNLTGDIAKDVKASPHFQELEKKFSTYQPQVDSTINTLGRNLQSTGTSIADRLRRATAPSYFEKDDSPLS